MCLGAWYALYLNPRSGHLNWNAHKILRYRGMYWTLCLILQSSSLITAIYYTICKKNVLGRFCFGFLHKVWSCNGSSIMSARNVGLLGKSAKHLVTNLYAVNKEFTLWGCHMTSLVLQAKCTNALLSVHVDFNQMVILPRLLLIKLKCISIQHIVFTC